MGGKKKSIGFRSSFRNSRTCAIVIISTTLRLELFLSAVSTRSRASPTLLVTSDPSRRLSDPQLSFFDLLRVAPPSHLSPFPPGFFRLVKGFARYRAHRPFPHTLLFLPVTCDLVSSLPFLSSSVGFRRSPPAPRAPCLLVRSHLLPRFPFCPFAGSQLSSAPTPTATPSPSSLDSSVSSRYPSLSTLYLTMPIISL